MVPALQTSRTVFMDNPRYYLDNKARYSHFVAQKMLVESHFPCFKCSLHLGNLVCRGSITPSDGCSKYSVQICYKQNGIPEVRIINPTIPKDIWRKVHIYDKGMLCLYDCREQPWKCTDNLHEKIIPWTAEWLVFYELFLICGKWLGPEALHGTAPKTSQQALQPV